MEGVGRWWVWCQWMVGVSGWGVWVSVDGGVGVSGW